MAKDQSANEAYGRPLRRLFVIVLITLLVLIFLFWRIDSPRAERLRAQVVDQVVPAFDWVMVPVARGADTLSRFQSYARLVDQNRELRRELQQMRAWREAALQLEQENAKLLDLNKVRLDPSLTFVTGVVLADSGSPFRQSVLLNVGARDGIQDGWATTDGLGLVGRISGVGNNSSRVLLLTDPGSRVPVTVQPSGQDALLAGDSSAFPLLDFVEVPDAVRAGDRVVSSGDGGVFPSGLLVGQVVQGTDGRLRLQLSADYERLEFLRVLRSQAAEQIDDPGTLVAPPLPLLPDPELAPTDGEEVAGNG
ncbi:MAG: rod shape-determining protein MreC [Rhodobacteraceae bacterium]|nr:rod shape-determining protein MreC [Paracoccaceae bacterium]